MTLINEPTSPVDGVPRWAQESLLQWLTPILEARQENKYFYNDGLPTPAFALLAERRLHITLLWSYDTKGAIEDLVRQMRSADRPIAPDASAAGHGGDGIRASNHEAAGS